MQMALLHQVLGTKEPISFSREEARRVSKQQLALDKTRSMKEDIEKDIEKRLSCRIGGGTIDADVHD